MVMGRRADVETAGRIATTRSLLGLGAAIGSSLVGSALRRPWDGPADAFTNTRRTAVRAGTKAMMSYATDIPTPELRSIEIVLDDVCGVVLPLPGLRGHISVSRGTVGGVSGYWVDPEDVDDRGTLLYLHGGGYLATTPRMYTGVVGRLALNARCRVFLPDYRLAPEFPYPAALDDALSAYDGIRAVRDPSQIIVAGDSGGGGLAAALLAELGTEDRPHPAGAVLLSPEVDLLLGEPSVTANAAADILPDEIPVEAYLAGADPTDPLASPLYADPSSYPPMLVTAGGEEMFVDAIEAFVARANGAGVEVEYLEYAQLFHVFEILLPWSTETHDAFDAIRAFVDRQLGR